MSKLKGECAEALEHLLTIYTMVDTAIDDIVRGEVRRGLRAINVALKWDAAELERKGLPGKEYKAKLEELLPRIEEEAIRGEKYISVHLLHAFVKDIGIGMFESVVECECGKRPEEA